MASGIPTDQSITYVSAYFHVKRDGKTIDTVVTSQGEVVEQWVNELLMAHATDSNVVVGLHIQWHYYLFNLHLEYGESATMQLCIDTKCLIIQLFHIKEIPQSFKDFLMNPKFTFMGLDAHISKLVSERGLDFAKTADYQAATVSKWPRKFEQLDLKYLAKHLTDFDMKISNYTSLMSDWTSAVLDNSQVEYACINAYALYKIAKVILADK